MASQVPRTFVLANFKPTLAERAKAKRRDTHNDREGNDRAHLALITQLPCCSCGCHPPGTQYHHLKSGPAKAERGAGLKATDKWAVPLCNGCHMLGVERLSSNGEPAWFAERGIEPYELARALWNATGNLFKMSQIVAEHISRGRP